jgi:predicted PurR-regulated permease PerM
MQDESSEAPPRFERGYGPEQSPVGSMARAVIGAIVVTGLYFARPVLEPIALAMLLALLLAPAVRWLHLRGIGRAAAVFATVLFAFIVIAGFAAAVGDEVITFARNLPQYEDNIATKIRSLHGVVPGAGILDRAT